ncbi:PQQ-binding-like beta-propeller repeat protein [Ktedonobacter racemifer]|uniref:Pyrrolo-quinoline quinone beta-propeller repeat protein n=1 Tax=Ktedonobacter racemifer DSM 44963 TaxID=485913 RepID=D6TQC2_KTERA|nr:PQQ-binding-like beta-propeller repeat protein [Ktedonobacter racemifer]EFH85770.1 Pyrrolo-quinoline quinone beta-propeller repeat protein [Ktedonobacter racemifer DSM 44963]
MGTPEDEQTINDTEVEMTDLDPPGTVHKVLGIRVIQGQRLSFQTRWFLLLLTIMGGFVFLFLWLPNIPQGAKDTHPAGTPVVAHPTFVPKSLSLLDGVIYITTADENIHALRASDGSLLWRHPGLVDAYPVASTNGVVFLLEPQSGMVDALRISDGTVLWQRRGLGWSGVENGLVFVSEETTIKALRVSDGSLVWQRKVARQGLWVANGIVYALPDFGGVGAFRATDGSPLWHHNIDGLPLGVDNHMIYLDLWDHSAAALRTSDGSLVWNQKNVQADTLSSIRNGMLYFLTPSGELDALRASDGSLLWHKHLPAANVAGAYVNAYDQVVALCFENGARDFLRASDGSLLWHAPNTTSGSAYGLEADDSLTYFSTPNGGVDARRVTDGMLLWHRPVKGNVMLIEKSIIYFTTDDGSIHAMRGSDGTLLWHHVLRISALIINQTTQHDTTGFSPPQAAPFQRRQLGVPRL